MTILFQYIKTHKFWTSTLLLVVLIVVYYLMRPPQAPRYEVATVKQGDVVQEVSVTGRVNAASEVTLAFERGGRVISTPVPVGTTVKSRDALVRLDASELSALRAAAKANIEFEMANLAQLKRGSRAEDIAVSQASVESAIAAVGDARISFSDKLSAAATVADDAIFNKTDYLFDNPRTNSPRALFPAADQKLVSNLEQSRAAFTELFPVEGMMIGAEPSSGFVKEKAYFSTIKTYLDNLASAINAVTPSSQYSQTTIDGWKANVSLARMNMNTAISALLLAEQSYRTALGAQNVAENQLALKKAGPTEEGVIAQEAKINAMRASLENYDAQIAKMTITAPFPGVITKQEAKLGQTIAPNAVVVSLQSLGKFQIEVNVPEVDVAKLSIGDKAEVTLDAYGADEYFPAVVSLIDPAETILEGVSTYKVTLEFEKDDARIRSGMTANIDILTDKKENVLYIPLRAVNTIEGKKFVRIPQELGEKEVEVTLGLRGSDGTIEVQSGLTLGQTVIIFSAK